ncbi:biotin synthase BioB [Desulfonauticus submarinus]
MFTEKDALNLAEKSLKDSLGKKDLELLAKINGSEILSLLAGSSFLTRNFFSSIQLCSIVNARSGKCSEDCAFCAQSKFYSTSAPVYPFKSPSELICLGNNLAKTPVKRYSLVTSGKGLELKEIEKVIDVLGALKNKIKLCASLGILSLKDLTSLKKAGLNRYHHNLETSASFFPKICSTHTYEERILTIKRAKEAGLSVCSGGVFGLGESISQVIELALTLKDLKVDAIPLNFLIPIPGTPLEKANFLTPLYCLKIIAIFRYILPDKEIIVCGGRKQNFGSLHPLVFLAGASGIMTGNYLTKSGFSLDEDLNLLKSLQFHI